LFKKKEDKSAEPEEEEEEKKEGSGDEAMNVGALVAEITKIKATLDSFKEIRKANSERFATINEQIGEIRGQIMDANRSMGVLEVKTTKAADLVESVHPDKLMIQVQRSDGKVEALRGLVESKDAMIQNILDQIKGMRNQMKVFKGIEEVLKMNEQIKTEVMNMKKISAMVERHADRIEDIFMESQKTFKEFNELLGQVEMVKSNIKELGDKTDKLDVKTAKYVDRSEFEKRLNQVDTVGKRLKAIADDAEEKLKKLDVSFSEAKGELKGAFDERLGRAEKMSAAFTKVISENPLFAKGLNLPEYMKDGGAGGPSAAETPKADAAKAEGTETKTEAAKPT
jgi:chromosome segregation ATPase